MNDDTPARDLNHECEVLLGRREPGLVQPIVSLEHLQYLDALVEQMSERYVLAIVQLAMFGDPVAMSELSSRGLEVANATSLVFPTKGQVIQ